MFELTTVNTMLEGFMGNMSEDQIDQELDLFQQIADSLGGAGCNYDSLSVIIDKEYFVDDTLLSKLETNLSCKIYMEKNKASGWKFLYFIKEEDAIAAVKLLNQYMEEG